jgi:hypothetical protein
LLVTRKIGKFSIGAVVTLVIALGLASVGIAGAVSAFTSPDLEASRGKGDKAVSELKSQQRAALSAPAAWVDPGKRHVSMPIERAMEVVVEELQRNPASATPPEPDAGPDARAPDAGPKASAGADAAPANGVGAGAETSAPPKDKSATEPKGGSEVKSPHEAKGGSHAAEPAPSAK